MPAHQPQSMKRFLLSRARSTVLFLVFPLAVILAGSVVPLWAQGQPARFAYVTNDNSRNISAYTINQTTGALTPISGSPFGAGNRPCYVTVHPTGRFLYATNCVSNDVSAYTID